MSEAIPSGTAEGLTEFLERAAKRGDMAPATANAQRIAVAKVLEIEPDPRSVDIRTLDVEDVLGRFVRLRGMSYKPDSLETYQSRFRTAVGNYRRYLEDPASFRFRRRGPVKTRRSKPRSDEDAPETAAGSSSMDATTLPEADGGSGSAPAVHDALVQYPFPLKMGGTAYIQVPRQITRSDVDRLVGFLNSLVIEDGAPTETLQAPERSTVDR